MALSKALVAPLLMSVFVALPARAEIIDLSKPNVGKSQYVFGADGTPAEVGPSTYVAPPPRPSRPHDPNPQRMRDPAAMKDKEKKEQERRAAATRIIVVGGGKPASAPSVKLRRR